MLLTWTLDGIDPAEGAGWTGVDSADDVREDNSEALAAKPVAAGSYNIIFKLKMENRNCIQNQRNYFNCFWNC